MKRSIWVICDECKFDSDYILQLLGKAKILAKQSDRDVSMICIGKEDEESFKRLFEFGADNIIFYENNVQNERVFIEIISNMMKEKQPSLLMFSDSQFAKVVAASLSSRFESGLTADCIDVELDEDDKFIFSRAALNDTVVARIKCINSNFQMCTIKKSSVPIPESKLENACGNIEKFDMKIDDKLNKNLIEIIERVIKEDENKIDLNSAKVVFAIGRGVKNLETVSLIKKIAKKLDAEVIGTRAAVEEGLIEKERQVGQSAISICPNIYFGFGISGASQHMVGIKNAKIIIAVNSDKEASIFNYSDYAIVDDLNNVLKELDILTNNL